MKLVLISTLFFISSFFTVNTMAQQPEPTPQERAENATEVRQAVFKLLGTHMGPIGAMARGRTPFDAALVQKNSTRIAQLAAMITDQFQADTREFEVETLALDKIWDNKDDFASHAQDLVDKATALSVAAQSGDQATTMQAFRPVGGACGNCHDNYRLDVD